MIRNRCAFRLLISIPARFGLHPVARFWSAMAGLLLFSNAATANELQPLSDGELQAVTGQKGILISFEYYYNSSPTDSASTADFDESGQPLTGSSGCSTPDGSTSLANMNCRFALQLKNRETEWLVFKNGYASMAAYRLSLDAATLGESRGADSTYSGYFDAAKFQDVNGQCLLGPGNCSAGYIAELAAMRTHYPETGGSYNPTTHQSSNYNDVRLGLFFEGLAVEPNSAISTQDGWQMNNQGSFMGMKIGDNYGYQAGIAFGGDFYLYGF